MENDMDLRRDQFRSLIERKVDDLQDYVDGGLEQIIRQQLRDWRKRYPRHQFRAFVGHGTLQLDVQPPLHGETSPQWADHRFPIRQEAEELIDYFNEFDFVRIGMSDTPWIEP